MLTFEPLICSTALFALNDFLGELRFLRITWLTILAIAFSSINLAGFARLFTSQHGFSKPKEVWYLFGAWLLADSMNAMLTWWGVTLAIVNLQSVGISVIKNQILIKIVPVFLAIMVG